MQPFARGMKGGAEADVVLGPETVSCFSMSMESPNSLTEGGVKLGGGGGEGREGEELTDDGDFLAVLGGEDVVEEGGFAGTEVAGYDCDGDFFGGGRGGGGRDEGGGFVVVRRDLGDEGGDIVVGNVAGHGGWVWCGSVEGVCCLERTDLVSILIYIYVFKASDDVGKLSSI